MADEPGPGTPEDKVVQRSVDFLRLAARTLAEFRRREREEETSFEAADIQEVVLVAQVLSSTALLASVNPSARPDLEGLEDLRRRIHATDKALSDSAKEELARVSRDIRSGKLKPKGVEGVAIGDLDWRRLPYPRPAGPPFAEMYADDGTLRLVTMPLRAGDLPRVTLHKSVAEIAPQLENRMREAWDLRQGGGGAAAE